MRAIELLVRLNTTKTGARVCCSYCEDYASEWRHREFYYDDYCDSQAEYRRICGDVLKYAAECLVAHQLDISVAGHNMQRFNGSTNFYIFLEQHSRCTK